VLRSSPMTAPAIERPDVTAPPPDRLLTRAEVAAVLRVSERTVDRYAAEGMLTRRKVGKRLTRFSEAEVRALANQAED
jgi:excisionase family DNA binding protein